MKVVLFNGPQKSLRLAEEHLGFGILGAVIKENGYEVDILDSPARGMSYEAAKEQLLNSCVDADVLGISLFITSYKEALEIAHIAKQLHPNLYIIIGGHMASFWYTEILKDYPWINSVIRGEGEIAIIKLIKALEENGDISKVPNLAYLKNGEFIHNEMAPLVDIDTLPDVLRPNTKYLADHLIPISITASRGCYGNCVYCSINSFYSLQNGAKWRPREPKKIVEEIKRLIEEIGTNSVKIVDDNFLAGGEKYIREFVSELKKHKIKLRLRLLARANDILKFRNLLPELREVGLEVVSLGIESFTPRTLKFFKKGIRPGQNLECLEILNENGIKALCGMILLEPFTTPEELEINIKALRETYYTLTHPLHNKVFVHQGDPLQRILSEKGMLRRNGYEWEYDFVNPIIQELDQALNIWSKTYNKHHYLVADCLWTTRQLPEVLIKEILESFYVLKDIELTLFENLIEKMKKYTPGILVEEVKKYYDEKINEVIKIATRIKEMVENSKIAHSENIH